MQQQSSVRFGIVCTLLLVHVLMAVARRDEDDDATAERLAMDLKDHIKAQLQAGKFDSNVLSDKLKNDYSTVSCIARIAKVWHMKCTCRATQGHVED